MNIAANSTSTSNSSKPSHSTGSSPKVKLCQPEMASPKWYNQVPIRSAAAAEDSPHSPVLLEAENEVLTIGQQHKTIVHKKWHVNANPMFDRKVMVKKKAGQIVCKS